MGEIIILGSGVKGGSSAARDAAVLKTIYAYGLRRTETSMVDLVDFSEVEGDHGGYNENHEILRLSAVSLGSRPV
jgi:hypothetical protein